MNLLLISNSGRPYLEHCLNEISAFLEGSQRAVFVSSAVFSGHQSYCERVRAALEPMDIPLLHLNLADEPDRVIAESDAILVGGGNTYLLLKTLREAYLIEPIRKRVQEGIPFVGWSAGANIAGPNILTSNDWNVVGLSRFEALGLVPFNINPHYKEIDPTMARFSETRDERIAEYHRVQANPVLGIEEQTMVHVEGDVVEVLGEGRVRRFDWNRSPRDYRAGETIELKESLP